MEKVSRSNLKIVGNFNIPGQNIHASPHPSHSVAAVILVLSLNQDIAESKPEFAVHPRAKAGIE
jgi:hypothetical protein